MRTRLWRVVGFSALLAVVLTAVACNKAKNNDLGIEGPGPGMAGGPWPGMGGPGRPPTPIGEIMIKLSKGPGALTPTIGKELKTDPPPWDEIQPQAKEYAQLAASLGKLKPSKGSEESWTKLTGAYAASAAELDHAAAAKDKAAALAAHAKLTQSCMACHREHRAGPGGMGQPGFPPGGPPPGFPPGGPPPGFPPGGPPPGQPK